MRALGGILTPTILGDYQPTLVDPLVAALSRCGAGPAAVPGGRHHVGAGVRHPRRASTCGHGHNSAPHAAPGRRGQPPRYADRSAYVGDPDLSISIGGAHRPRLRAETARRDRLDRRRACAAPARARASASHEHGRRRRSARRGLHDPSVWWSIAEGNMVSVTQTLTLIFGSAVDGAGYRRAAQRQHEPVRSAAGRPERGRLRKRPASNMAHVIAVRDGVPVLAVGAPGGRRILDTCLQMTLDVVDFGLDIQRLRGAADRLLRSRTAGRRPLSAATRERTARQGHSRRRRGLVFAAPFRQPDRRDRRPGDRPALRRGRPVRHRHRRRELTVVDRNGGCVILSEAIARRSRCCQRSPLFAAGSRGFVSCSRIIAASSPA